MSAPLVFAMGKFEACFPTDRRYARNHMWAIPQGDAWRFGLAAYAVRLLQDVYFLDWNVPEGAALAEKQAIGFIESKKAESELFAPVAGTLFRPHDQLLSDPSAINVDMYGDGWLFEMNTSGEGLLTPEEYLEHLQQVWPIAQRTIKGQLNE